MKLIVSGLDKAPADLRFKHLWAYYVIGFKPWKHCDSCLNHTKAMEVGPDMKDGEYQLKDQPFLYLCGVGQLDTKSRKAAGLNRGKTNVHLAVRPRLGSVASIGSVYGVTFTIHDAQAIPIEPLAVDFQGLDEKHYRCKNFQFGYQTFNVGEVSTSMPHDIVHQLRSDPPEPVSPRIS
jgi:hypothetical protein